MRKTIALALAATLLTACSKDVIEDSNVVGGSPADANSILQVRTTRAAGNDETSISYPVQVYVFQGDECCALQTIGDEGQTLNIPLVEGTYTVFAIGGASSTDYTIPTKGEATTTTPITLKDGKTLTDLMAAKANVTLIDGGTNTVTLGMERKVMLIQDITINKVPTVATAVSVTIAPLWEKLTVGGTYSGTNGSNTIALTKQEDNRTWTTTANAYLLPPSDSPASISVNITTAGTTKSYTYITADELEAGYKLNISGTYTEAVGVSLTGTITGATWKGERTITFTFDENGSSSSVVGGSTADNDSDIPGSAPSWLPAIGSTYQSCTVLAATATSDDTADLLLLAPEPTAGFHTIADLTDDVISYALSQSATVTGISDWRMPTAADMPAFSAATVLTPDRYYLYDADGTIRIYRAGQPWPTGTTAVNFSGGKTLYLRPVAEVSINKE